MVTGSFAQNVCPVIPMPANAKKTNGVFLLNAETVVRISDKKLQPISDYLKKELLKVNQISLSRLSTATAPSLNLVLLGKENDSSESYRLVMSSKKITIAAPGVRGVFYGVVSLLQLIAQSPVKAGTVTIACWKIEDKPQYAWRGFMLDESRHFFGEDKLKSIFDWMAFYKLNRFHWHLTDEPGWRLEIKKYPLLGLKGGIGNYSDAGATAKFYTQETIHALVQYAAERQITIVPEIDMPGHATAANKAYPQFSGGGSAKHPEFTFNPGKAETYTYLTDILREVNAIFPAGMVHLGGDEVSFGHEKWQSDSLVLQLMKEKELKNLKAVENYFISRMADSLFRLGSGLLAWDEVADAALPADKTIIFWWRHDKPEQLTKSLQKGYKVVLCPRLPLYFDFVQDSTHTPGRKWQGLYNSLDQVYYFSAGKLLHNTSTQKNQVMGIQANLWTETIPSAARLDFMLFPRIAALAEAAWSPEENRNFEGFRKNLEKHFEWYKTAGLNYFDPFKTGLLSNSIQ